MFFKKKRLVAVEKRTPDTVPFVVPEIAEENKKEPYQKNRFVSPIFGTKVKDEIVIPNPHKRFGDTDKQYDTFRTKPRLTKADRIKKYGSEFPEFDLVSGRNLNEAMEAQGKRSSRKNKRYEEVEEPRITAEINKELKPTTPIEKAEVTPVKPDSNINDYINKLREKRKDIPKEVIEKHQELKTEKSYRLPPFSLLSKPVKKTEESHEWIDEQIAVLNKTFQEFNVGASVFTHTKGPTVTRYEIVLDSGVNVKKVTSISDNIKMALAAKEIRIEAPIPGKSTIGIEVPNKIAEIVPFIDIVEQAEFVDAKDPLTVGLGLDIDGKGVYASITKMPHGLVAGATGSGKSVCINTILMSFLFKYSPDELKLLLVDPKMVELSAYNEIPHLLTPVITDAKIATAALKWAVEEMENRFRMFSRERVKDITTYNIKVKEEGKLKLMPYIVIVVDELADLMTVASRTVESAIMRLTQKARACGIHLIIATQRPSTDVIKGTIKSNIPTRLAFMVSSYVDSMTIIDSVGADKLLGRGDMLYAESGQPQRRVQGAYVSDLEIKNVIEFITRQRKQEYFFTQEKLVKKAIRQETRDELFDDIASYVVSNKEASINKISKAFKIGFNRAQKIVETMADLGIVSDNVGSKARSVLINEEELTELLNKN